MKSLEVILTALIKGFIYALGFIVTGGLAGLILGKGFLTGAYILTLVGACVAMLITVAFAIGSPKARFNFFKNKGYKGASELESLGSGALYPGIIAVELLVIGFMIEAMLH